MHIQHLSGLPRDNEKLASELTLSTSLAKRLDLTEEAMRGCGNGLLDLVLVGAFEALVQQTIEHSQLSSAGFDSAVLQKYRCSLHFWYGIDVIIARLVLPSGEAVSSPFD